jgi:hypothetical protein
MYQTAIGPAKAADTAEAETAPTTRKGKKRGRREGTVAEVACRLILEGKTNDEVWKVLKEQFNLDDKKKYYPGWHRANLKRRGELPGEAATPATPSEE